MSPAFAFPDATNPFVVFVDASGVSIGSALMQKKNIERYHSIHWSSLSLSREYRRYRKFDHEAVAFIFALKSLFNYFSVNQL